MSQTLSPPCSLLWSGARCAGVEDLARQRLSLSQGDAAEPERPSPWSGWRLFGPGTGRPHPPAHRRLPPSRRGLPQVMGAIALRGVRASPRRVRRVMRANGLLAPHRVGRTEVKPHDGLIITGKVNEMSGTDMTQTTPPGRPGQCLRRRGTLQFGGRRHPCIAVGHRFGAWSRCVRGCIGASEPSRPGWRVD